MEDFVETNDLNNGFINEIVCKVKSEGLFDQFRRECLADVDTKPAYQNLQNRVEFQVNNFLENQDWHPQLNKNQLREKLRKLVLEKKFFEAGIERIVDQVVNPKLNSNFVPKIEEIAYKFMGVERPSEMSMKLEIETDILPVCDLEQVSPDSEKSRSNDSKLPINVLDTHFENHQIFDYFDAKTDDLESPAFEPIEPPKIETKSLNNDDADDDMDISDGSDTPHQMNEIKSNVSSISGLTSNDSNTSTNDFVETSFKNITEKHVENKETGDLVIDQDSELSQVSSDTTTSRLSIVTTNITNSNDEYNGTQTEAGFANSDCLYGISEEAQMQKFNESSSSTDSSTKTSMKEFSRSQITQFNIKNENIKFEGTERINSDLNNFSAVEGHLDISNGENSKNSMLESDRTDSKKKQSNIHKYKQQRRSSGSISRSSKKDDHFTHKGKATARQRSHSKDSNDGYTIPKKAEQSNMPNTNQSQTSKEQACTQYSSETDNTAPTEAAVSEPLLSNNISSQPVVIDQILVGNDLDLKTFIVENRADPIISSIEEEISTKAKKPKVAENIFEAKRLMKVRKQIELRYQKKIEQATVKAKQYIRTNVTSIRDESQGVELEFLCREQQSSSTTSSLEKSFENESETFKGFDCMEKDRAKIVHQTFFEKVNEQFIHGNVTAEKESEIILANVFISDNYRRSESTGKQRQTARYSNEDLFKPRPLLCGISKRRREILSRSSAV